MKILSNMYLTGASGSHSRPGPSDKGQGSATHPQVSSPAVPRPRCAPKFYRTSDPVPMRVFYKKRFQNIGHEVPCEWDCTMPNCLNRVQTDFVRVGPSNILRGVRSIRTRCHQRKRCRGVLRCREKVAEGRSRDQHPDRI